jgi:hypothetical protein
MSFHRNKTVTLIAVIILVSACSITSAAQTRDVVKNSKANPYSLREQKESASNKESVPSAKDTDLTTEPDAVSEVSSRSANSQTDPSDKWQFQFSPYFWLAGLHGTAGVGNRTAQVGESFSDIFDALNFAFMGTFEAHKGKFVSLTDLEYVSVSDEKATPGPLFSTVDAGFKIFIFDQEVGYQLLGNAEKGASLDVLGGARVWRVKTDFEFGAGILPAARIEGSRSWVDAVGGLRGKMALSQKLFLTGKFDLGGGGSQFTWQAFAGAGYSLNPKIALIFGYRVLDVDYDKNNFVFDMNQRGPIMGLGFRF